MRTVRRRRELILGLIATRRVETQEELVEALHAAGAVASQASVSRDIQALGLVKIGGQWALPAPPEHGRNPAEERLRSYLLEAAPAGPYLLVLKTPPGEAPGVGAGVRPPRAEGRRRLGGRRRHRLRRGLLRRRRRAPSPGGSRRSATGRRLRPAERAAVVS